MTDVPQISEGVAGRARFYRERAEEIRQMARRANDPDAVRDLLKTASCFDLMAAFVENSTVEADCVTA